VKLKTLKSGLQHQPKALATLNPDSWRTDKQTSTQRGYGYKWQQAREEWLRDHPLCVICQEVDKRVTAATVVDHIEPHRGDQKLFWRRSNWRSLCAPHHNSDAQRKDRTYGRVDGQIGPQVLAD
jgi:5-methylcytosine-specific restriction protein A